MFEKSFLLTPHGPNVHPTGRNTDDADGWLRRLRVSKSDTICGLAAPTARHLMLGDAGLPGRV